MPRKTRITVVSLGTIFSFLVIAGLILVLVLNTDMFKSSEKLFTKYAVQNIKLLDIIQYEDALGVDASLKTNKYESNLFANIEYTANKGTSDENKDNPINEIELNVKSNVDKANDFRYRDISVTGNDEDLMKAEYINDKEDVAVRLNGIKQFVVFDNDRDNLTSYSNIDDIFVYTDILSKLDFSEQEKQSLATKYTKVLKSNISKDKYGKQKSAVITVNNKDINTKAYYLKLNFEDYNNLIVKLLEQIEQDDIILNKIDMIENEIKENYPNYENDSSLREQLVDKISKKIEQIQNNNIGNEEIQITLNINNKKLVRTSIEKATEKFIVDFFNNSSVKIDKIELGDVTNETSMQIEKNSNEIAIEYEKTKNDEIVNNLQLKRNVTFENDAVTKKITCSIASDRHEAIINITDDIKIIDEFENDITLETDSVKLTELGSQQVESIKSILLERFQGQLADLTSVLTMQNITQILKDLDIVNIDFVAFPQQGEVTEIQKQRFNSQFEFFQSENLTTENIKELINVSKNNLEDIKVALKTGEIEAIDVEKLNSQEEYEYLKNISEIIIYIKADSKNQEKQDDILKLLEKISSNKYDVTIQYDNDGLVNTIRAKIQEDQY